MAEHIIPVAKHINPVAKYFNFATEHIHLPEEPIGSVADAFVTASRLGPREIASSDASRFEACRT